MTLDKLPIGVPAIVLQVGGEGEFRLRLLDMGILPGTLVKVQKYAPLGDPLQMRVRDFDLVIRLQDAAHIEVMKI